MTKEIFVSDALAKEPSYIAFQEADKKGQFENLEPGTWVAYVNGELVGTGADEEKLLREALGKAGEGVFIFISPVNVTRTPLDLPEYP